MFKIGEFSKLTQVSIRMLRYYDEVGLLKPNHVDATNGYRLYAVEQIPILNKIIYLRDSGFNVSEIIIALNSKDDALIVKQLAEKQEEIKANIEVEHEKLAKIEIAKTELLHEKKQIHYNLSLKSVPSYPILSLRKIIPNYYFEGELWQELAEFVHQNKVPVLNDTFSIYHDEDYREENVDVEVCVVVSKLGQDVPPFTFHHTEAVATMACTMVYGEFSNINEAYLAFAQWLQENKNYQMKSESRQIVHRGPWNEENPKNYLTEIQIPLKKIK